MKKLNAMLLATMSLLLLGTSSAAAFEQVYVCGAINGQGYREGSAIKLTTENGWFKLSVTDAGEFKVSSTVGATDNDWEGFNGGVAKFLLGSKSINTIVDAESNVSDNSTIPSDTKVVYFSSDLKKAAASDGNWLPEAYTPAVMTPLLFPLTAT